jgi:hypothetical protein
MSQVIRDASAIARLNDAFRQNPGRVICTKGIKELGHWFAIRAIGAVQAYTAFTPDNDPHGEHDFGSFTLDGQTLFWKIDVCTDDSFTVGAEDPADPKAARLLILFLAEEY